MNLRVLLLSSLFACPLALAQAPEPADPAAAEAEAAAARSAAEQFEASLNYRNGTIDLPGAKARLNVPQSFRYLDPRDSARLLEEGWGNPPGDETLGMLVPADVSPLTTEGWGVVISYAEDGHVSDSDADGIDYAKMLSDMQSATEEENEERKKQGYQPAHLVGWAEPPYYDHSARKLHWAKEFTIGDASEHTLNYNVRVLGREGVLVLNAVAGMSQFTSVKQQMGDVLAMAEFTPGNTYAEFNEGTDKTAAYGLAALVGGAVAAKSGLLAKLLVLLLAAKKFLIIAVVGVLAAIKGLFSRFRKS